MGIECHAAARSVVYYVQNGGQRYGVTYADIYRTYKAITGVTKHALTLGSADSFQMPETYSRVAVACAKLATPSSVTRLNLVPVFEFFKQFTPLEQYQIMQFLESRYDLGYHKL